MSSMAAESPARERLSSDERRAQILEAARAVFGAKGYVATTTDDIARAASVSQPYVVRLFGSKESLFLAVLDEAVARLIATFREAAQSVTVEAERNERIGRAYIDLLRVPGLHQMLSQTFLLGAHPVIGPRARTAFIEVWRVLREIGFDPEAAQAFLAQGMLVNTLVGLRLAAEYDADASVRELYEACFPVEQFRESALAQHDDQAW